MVSSDDSAHEDSDDHEENAPVPANSHCSTILESPNNKAKTLPNLKSDISPISSSRDETLHEKENSIILCERTKTKLSAFRRLDKNVCDSNNASNLNEKVVDKFKKRKGSLKEFANKLKKSKELNERASKINVGRDEDFDFEFDL